MKTTQKGDIAWLRVAERAIEKGWMVSRPIQESGRYDLVLDDGERLYRVQVKYADGRSGGASGTIICGLKRTNGSGINVGRKYQSNEVDAVVAYLPRLGKFGWFPPSVFEGKSNIHIRYEDARNGQAKGCVLLSDYEW